VAGNSVVRTGPTLALDTLAPVQASIGTIAGNDVINLSEANANVTLSGTTEIGSTVSVRVGASTNTFAASVDGTGHWSLSLTKAQIETIGQGAKQVVVTNTDTFGNATVGTAKSITVDTVAPTTATLTNSAVLQDGYINLAESNAAGGVVLSGTTEVGTTVAVAVGAGNNFNAAVDVNGNWSLALTKNQIEAIGQGAKAITVTSTDVAGNPTVLSGKSVTIDTVSPIAPKFDGVLVNADGTATISGFYTTADNLGITINGTKFTPVLSGGQWSVALSKTFVDAASGASQPLVVVSTDLAGNTSTLSTGFNFANNAPTDITLSASSVTENVVTTLGYKVADLTVVDVDKAGNNNILSIGAGGDAALFEIKGSALYLKPGVVVDYETKPSYTVNLVSTDPNTGKGDPVVFSKTVTIAANNVNEAPTAITLSASSINENNASGAVVATLSATDPDLQVAGMAGPFTYELVSGNGAADNSAFMVDGTSLKLQVAADFETKLTYDIRLKVTDAGGQSFETTKTIAINTIYPSMETLTGATAVSTLTVALVLLLNTPP
jgi:hypothetical protein